MTATITLEKNRTPRQRLAASAYQGRHAAVTAGSHLFDLMALGKALILCPDAYRKLKPELQRHGYQQKPNLPRVRGKCDATKQFAPNAYFLVKGEAA